MTPTKKVLLIILDGFGLRKDSDFNAIANAKMKNWQSYTQKYTFGSIDASGTLVGLPEGQFGNSEVGHLNIGAGRVVKQDITRIDESIANDTFKDISAFKETLASTNSKSLHIMGLLSDGGVHAHINHIISLIKLAESATHIEKIWLHVFLDGRDTPPKSALTYLAILQNTMKKCKKTQIATMIGRYYAMDRDKRYDRTYLAYDAIVNGKSNLRYHNPNSAIESSYTIGEYDEFIKPCIIEGYQGISDGDSVIFANFRSDRAIQLTDAMISKDFDYFKCKNVQLSNFVTMTNYDNKFKVRVAFPSIEIKNTLGEYISNLGLHQLRIAETEKFPHVTYFFSGGRKEPYYNEERIIVDSPKDVKTYDQKPEMSLPQLTEQLVAAILENRFDFIITNFANGDMVGHSGNFPATIKAVEAIDLAMGKCIDSMQKIGGEVLITADHGNCEEMFDYKHDQPHTQHTTNLVPLLYIGRKAKLKKIGSLQDIAPTLITIAGLDIPKEMTGQNLLDFLD